MDEFVRPASGTPPTLPTITLWALAVALTAAIAIVVARFLSGVLAGLALALSRRNRVGNLVRIGGRFGRVTARGLLASEVLTEEGDLVTVPHRAGALAPLLSGRSAPVSIATDVTLGHDVSRAAAEALLRAAARDADLAAPAVFVLALGDRAVTYRVAGSLADLTLALDARARLRAAVLDRLQGGDVATTAPEIAAPSAAVDGAARSATDEDLDAATVEQLRQAHEKTRAAIARLADPPADQDLAEARRRQETLVRRLARIEKLISARLAASPDRRSDERAGRPG
ncbi:MAG TPA: mechanosensitive ion channel [Candidatus Krumholzibacteria bacterium]|nr:mechanosensitive ion channel [Candidatus Krumholzibacteria bacterium]HPD70756.1 mechanosensitive ion channel [Candidatus Krumholzibacteria bacterium]HRY39544.1 mechanosensitive ion channel [Candidatus Krumholzibacteria bacterium]